MEQTIDEFRENRAREGYERQLERSARLARRGSTGAAYAVPLLSGALYYFAAQCADDWKNLTAPGYIEVAFLGVAAVVGVAMSYFLFVAGFQAHTYRVLPSGEHWYSHGFKSFAAVGEELVGQFLEIARHNSEINAKREEAWQSFLMSAGLATGLVVVAACLDLARNVP